MQLNLPIIFESNDPMLRRKPIGKKLLRLFLLKTIIKLIILGAIAVGVM